MLTENIKTTEPIETTETIAAVQPEQVEVKNPEALLKKNRDLLKQLTETKAALQAAQDALGTAQGDKSAMSDRWYQLAVAEPLEADLRDAAAGPWKYLRDTSLELGLLKMQPDSEGFERPAWFDEKGKPADLSRGLHYFLNGVYGRTKNDLGTCLKAIHNSGGGSQGGGNYPPTSSQPAPKATTTQLGLR